MGKPERSSERLHGDVGALLKDLLDVSVSANHVTSLGLSVDLHAAARSRRSSSSTPVASVDMDGHHTLLRSLDPADTVAEKGTVTSRVRGQLRLKRRLLEKSGMTLVVFSEDDWRGIDASRDRRNCLRGLLRKAGVDDGWFKPK